jgi:hypothetical protein
MEGAKTAGLRLNRGDTCKMLWIVGETDRYILLLLIAAAAWKLKYCAYYLDDSIGECEFEFEFLRGVLHRQRNPIPQGREMMCDGPSSMTNTPAHARNPRIPAKSGS